ncbi:MAG TPA: aminotransferase class I/II-fold pyridoxal phosphate-dependent enzyme [Vicinamibacterales bacterium]|jgi:dTDP-4-amino-4,6-dideoxygalactose transaminase
MLTAISRYGPRVHPTTEQIIAACRKRGEFTQGPQVAAFEEVFARRIGAGHAIASSYGRMAFYFILKALQLPAGSEIICPALTFWGVPELARVAGLTVRFADVDPTTFCVDPVALERAITDRTRVIVPTHLYGLPCDMDAILDIAGRHDLLVVEDCAHALGATYRGRLVGTFGDGAFFSFQTLKPLNAYGGGMAVVRDADVARRVRAQVDALPWPDEKRISNKLLVGRLQRMFTRPRVFTFTGFPILWAASCTNAQPDLYLWEKIQSLDPLPEDYTERMSNVQATLALASLDHLDQWTAETRSHARVMNAALGDIPGVQVPAEPADRTHVYYQYCLYGPARDGLVRHCIRRGVDVETLHVDVCTRLDLFERERVAAPGADRAAQAIQVPVYASLTDRQLRRVTKVVRRAIARGAPIAPAAMPSKTEAS